MFSPRSNDRLILIVGQLDQSLHLSDAARVKGRILIPAEVPHEKLQLTIELTDASGELGYHFIEFDRTNGRFSRSHLGSGTAQLVLKGSGGLDLARSEYFSTEGTGAKTPAGWDALDLRSWVFVHRITVKGNDGSHPERVTLRLDSDESKAIEMNPVAFVTTLDPLVVTIEAEGYRPSAPVMVSGEIEVELQTGIPVTFRLPVGVHLPEGDWQARVFELTSTSLAMKSLLEIEVHADRTPWSAALPHAGVYELAFGLSIEHPAGPGGRGAYYPVTWTSGQHLTDFEISDSTDPQSVLINVTQQQLDTLGK